MMKLLEGLVGLSSLRDRDELDLATVALIGHTALHDRCTTRLVCLVGQANDQRWLESAWLEAAGHEVQRSKVWADWTDLPRRDSRPDRQAALQSNTVLHTGSGPYLSIFRVDTQQPVCSLLEIESLAPLSSEAMVLIQQILQMYKNLQSLLDYGEKDPLTELLNRKTFDRAFLRAAGEPTHVADNEVPERRYVDAGNSYWLAMLDVDHFKKVNDNYGHLIGDEVLLLLARHMRDCFRFYDQLYRFGGEEFVILMRCASHGDAIAVLDRFRVSVSKHAFPQVGTITISVGVSGLSPNDTPSTAIGRADKAVYFAKEHGRNQVQSYAQLVADGHIVEPREEVNETDFF